jgi:polar amino acid transport system substrate-binding protein
MLRAHTFSVSSFFNSSKTLRFFTACLALCLLFALSGCSHNTEQAQDNEFDVANIQKDDSIANLLPKSIKESGKLRVGTEATYAPAEFLKDDGKTVTGYDMDIAKALGKILGVDVDIQNTPFDSLVPSIGVKFDAVLASVSINKERLEQVDFIHDYDAGESFVVKKGNPLGIEKDTYCNAKEVAVQDGTVEVDDIETISEKCSADKTVHSQNYDSQDDAVNAVVAGKADAFFADSPVAEYAVAQKKDELEVLGNWGNNVEQGIAVKRGDKELSDVLYKAFQKLYSSGDYLNILKLWHVEGGAVSEPQLITKENYKEK